MCDKLPVRNSFGEIIREEKYSEYETFIDESVFILNVAKRIEEKYISKELGLKIRNLNEKEIDNCYEKIKEELQKAMAHGFEKMQTYAQFYNCDCHEHDFGKKIFDELGYFDFEFLCNFSHYIYAKSISMHGSINVNDEFVIKEDFENIENTATNLAKDVCSQLIVLEVENYEKLYSIMKHYYNLDDDAFKKNFYTEKFIYNFIKLINTLFLETDSFRIELFFYFKIEPYEKFNFKMFNVAQFFDGYSSNELEDKIVSKYLDKINKDFIDLYIKDNKQNLNNLLFITSRLYMEWDKSYEFNYREYNLNLISILELLLVNSKDEKDIKSKFVKNVLVCLAITDVTFDNVKEEKILRAIYNYRSCILHGNYSGYTNAMSLLEGLLNYKTPDFEISKYGTIDFLISEKLNHYVSSVFKAMSYNKLIVDILKN